MISIAWHTFAWLFYGAFAWLMFRCAEGESRWKLAAYLTAGGIGYLTASMSFVILLFAIRALVQG